MKQKIKILHLEDLPADAELVARALKKGEIDCEMLVVENKEKFIKALTAFTPDLILSDHSLASFDSHEALVLVKESGISTAFILITATMSDESAVELMKEGVDDYILKDRLYRLPAAINNLIEKRQREKMQQATEALLIKTEKQFHHTLDNMIEGVQIHDFDWNYVYVNNALVKYSGYSRDELLGNSMIERYPGIEQTALFTSLKRCMDERIPAHIETDFVFPDGSSTFFELSIQPIPEGIFILSVDRSEQKKAMEKLFKVNRLYSFISQINQNIVHVKDEEALFDNSCHIAINFGKFRMAWIGLFDKERKKIVIASQSGIPENDLALFNDVPYESKGPQDYVIRTGSYYVCNDVARDLELENWKVYAAQHGIQSCMVLPLRKASNIIGTLNLYASELDFFDEEEIRLLLEVTGDISFAIDVFDQAKKHAEAEQLEEFNKHNLRALINNTNDLMWSVNRDFNLITSNRAFDELGEVNFGKTIAKGENVLSVSYTPEMLAHFKALYERAFAGEAFTETEHFDHPVEMWTEISYNPIRKGDEIIGTACQSRDVTAVKITDQMIQESNERYELATKATNDVIWDWDILSDKMFRSQNYFEQFGYPCSSVNAYNDSWIENIHLEDRENTVSNMMEKLNNANDFVWEYQYRFYRANRELVYVNDRGHIVRDNNGKAIRMVGAMSDISKEKLWEEILLEEQKRLKEAQATGHLGSWEMNFVTNKSVWSEETYRIYGVSSEIRYFTYEDWIGFVHPEDLEHVMMVDSDARKTLGNIVLDHRILLKDGSVKYIHSESRFRLNEDGNPWGLYGITQDVTEMKLAEIERAAMVSELITRNKDLEQFTYIVSHNLRAPVANILGAEEALSNGDLTTQEKDALSKGLHESVLKLDHVVKDLNQILQAKREINQVNETVIFSHLVDDIKMSINNLLEGKDIQISYDFSEGDELLVSRSYLYSIFYNLISNSIKYRRQNVASLIEIKSKQVNGGIELFFTDNGLGIDLTKNSEQIFGLYKRFHSTIEGKGMGLFMVKTQVETLGGKISVKSEIDKGTEFKINFQM